MQTLTKRQKEIISYIKEYIEKYGYSPSFDDIAQHFGLAAMSTVHEHVSALVSKGYLQRNNRKERGLSLVTKQKPYMEIPLVGVITCGEPIEAIEDHTETINIARDGALRGKLYALKAKGDSMIGEGVFDGDTLIIKKQETAENGDTVVAIIDDNEATLKKYYQEKNRIRLQPANPNLKPFYRKEVEIRGVVVKIIRDLT